ncbi:MAG: VanW family protein [Acidimicrobiia bacterium]|nr:VanW family protein [Acidimicrobiia bacterium]
MGRSLRIAVLLGLLVSVLLLGVTAHAQEPPPQQEPPTEPPSDPPTEPPTEPPPESPEIPPLPPGGTFTDDDRLPEEGYIEAIAEVRVTLGCNPPANDRFCPERGVTRAQMASFFVRALNLPPAEDNPFTDTLESVHVNSIAALYAAGITRGCNPPDNDEYCPDQIVTRGQMAAFIARAWGYEGDVDTERFTDDDTSVFEGDISRIADAGISTGCGEGLFCPNDDMLRKHMAVFLGRALGLTPKEVPDPPEPIGSFTTYYDRCSDPCRVTNIRLIGDTVDGAVVESGEIFSINEYVGQRTEAKGYVRAGAIIGGELYCCDHPANIGGGTSQFATTLYNAVFFAGLEDIEHRPHSIWFSRYPMGREATLGWESPDVKFRNTTDWPIRIEVESSRTSITVTIVGVTDVVDVESIRTGTATTSDGGRVTIRRVITYEDGSTESQSWTHTYKGLPEDEPEPPPPPPPPPSPPPAPL